MIFRCSNPPPGRRMRERLDELAGLARLPAHAQTWVRGPGWVAPAPSLWSRRRSGARVASLMVVYLDGSEEARLRVFHRAVAGGGPRGAVIGGCRAGLVGVAARRQGKAPTDGSKTATPGPAAGTPLGSRRGWLDLAGRLPSGDGNPAEPPAPDGRFGPATASDEPSSERRRGSAPRAARREGPFPRRRAIAASLVGSRS